MDADRALSLRLLRGALLVPLLALLLVGGCDTRRDQVTSLAASHRMTASVIDGGPFDLYTLTPPVFAAGRPLSVYLEGDGYAFLNRWQLNDDPTPRRAVALEMAVRDPAPNVVYVARPCQYVTGGNFRNCHPAYWSVARYADPVIAATNRVIDRLLATGGARGVRLYGHSGGGAVALLVAARRDDVLGVVTVSGMLDTLAWTRMNDMPALAQSLNPADAAARLESLPQVHFVGAEDEVVPEAVARAYAAHFPAGLAPQVRVVPGQDHQSHWAEAWPDLLRQIDDRR